MRRDDLDRREGGMSSGLMMLIAAVVVFGLLFHVGALERPARG